MRTPALLAVAAHGVSASYLRANMGTNPITQVVNILKDMVEQMTKEQEDDDAVFAKLECWCKKNKEEQTQKREKAIADYDAAIAAGAKALASKQALQKVRDERFEKRTNAQQEVETKQATCRKEARESDKTSNNLAETVAAAKNAVMILTRGQSFVQTDAVKVTALLNKIIASPATKSLNKPEDSILLQGFVDDATLSNTNFLQAPGGYAGFTSQAGPVVGMLKAMITDLSNDMEQNSADEGARKKDCVESVQNLNKQIAQLAKQIEADEAQIGEYAEQQARQQETSDQANQDRKDSIAFLESLGKQCDTAKADYISRRDSRSVERKACSETIQILNNDEAFKSFQKNSATAVSFFQMDKRIKKGDDARVMALWALDAVAQKNASIYLIQSMIQSAISSKAKGGVFDKIISKIDEVIKVIRADLQEQIRMRDDCTEDIATLKSNFNEAKAQKNHEEENAKAAEAEIASLSEEIKNRQEEVKVLDQEITQKSSDRKEEEAVFMESDKDAQTTIQILKAALDKMVEVYGAKPGLLQGPGADVTEFKATASAPGSAAAAFTNQGKTTKNAEGGSEVLVLLNRILKDAEKELRTIQESESDSLSAYEESMRQATNEKNSNLKAIASAEKRRANAEGNHQAATENMDSLVKEMNQIIAELDATQKECKEVLTHFKTMQVRGKDEIEALKQAQTVLSGLNK